MDRIITEEKSTLLSQLVLRIEKEEEDVHRRANGIVICKADWDNLPPDVSSITVKRCNEYEKELNLSRFRDLESVKIEENCFPRVRRVRIEGLSKLKRIEIGSGCFKCEREGAALLVKDCSGLTELRIGDYAFSSFGVLQLNNLPSLEHMEIGKDCFKNADFIVGGV